MRSLKELAQESLDVQNASNPIAVATAYQQCLSDLRKHVNGWDQLNSHPINLMFISKINSMSGYSDQKFATAYVAVQQLANS